LAPLRGAPTKEKAAKKASKPKEAAEPKGPREGSKKADVLALLHRPGGATMTELMETTNWQAHTVRGFISASLGKKMGLTVESAKREDGTRAYSITK